MGDCYFLSALSVISERPEEIKKMFVSHKVNDQGIFAVNMYKNGQHTQIILDNYLPCNFDLTNKDLGV